MREEIKQSIDVLTIFHRTKGATPVKILWSGREYRILSTGYHYKVKNGAEIHHIFTVSAETFDMRLNFNTNDMSWTLEEISDGSAN